MYTSLEEQADVELPPDYQVPGEFVVGRLMYPNDLGDSWQWADDPDYPQAAASVGMRMGVNFAVYALTH